MCGIAGIVRFDGQPPSGDSVTAMCDVMFHRGPDDGGLYVDDAAALGMRRLSIIDLSTGHQPVRNEDGTIWTVFNGEIYNHRELRAELIGRGHRFASTTDTETLVHLYEECGPALVDRLRGMFTFAIWDRRKRSLLLARDRLGIKPLYYAQLDGALAFASELKALMQLPEVGRHLSWPAVGHLFTFLSTPADQSILEDVQKLEAGHRATLARDGRLQIDRYWDVTFAPDTRESEEEVAARLRELIRDAVGAHLVSDVPVGAFLSGGLDSSAVVALMAEHGVDRIKTFSIGFPDAAFDESAHAKQVAAALGTEHHTLVVEPQDLDLVGDLAWYLDEPFGDSSAIPTLMVSKLAAEHVKVVLTGDGGDELFAGYDKYVVEKRERRYDAIPSPVRRALGRVGHAMPEGMTGRNFLQHLQLDGVDRYLDACSLFPVRDQAKLFTRDVSGLVTAVDPRGPARARLRSGESWLSSLQQFDLAHYLPLDILTKVDRMSMAHSIESRPVLLDHPLVEFAATIPADLRLRGSTTKYVFKQAMRGIVPDSIIDRRKHGFAVPLGRWFRQDWAGFLRDLLLSDTCRQRGIFDRAYLEKLIGLHQAGRPLDLQLWTLVSFELWCRTFLDTTRAVQRVTATRAPWRQLHAEPAFAPTPA